MGVLVNARTQRMTIKVEQKPEDIDVRVQHLTVKVEELTIKVEQLATERDAWRTVAQNLLIPKPDG